MFKIDQIIMRKRYSSRDKKFGYPQRCKVLKQSDSKYYLLTLFPIVSNKARTSWVNKEVIHEAWKLARVRNTAMARKLYKVKINKNKEWIEL